MDKENQSNNLVGDGSNLSHENQLPPIWDNISQELNALDENHVSIDQQSMDSSELSNVADFSIIKDGFQATFGTKEPPKFMWDKIEQGLEAFTVTDAPSDFSAIKNGFEQNYKETAIPNFTWADLAEEMDNPKPKEKVENYDFVKRGFEKQYSAVVVPLFSWDDLAQRMDNEAALADTPDRYSIIKESFQKEYAQQHPAANTWANLNQQLQSESHWKKAWVLLSAPAFLKKAAMFTAIGVFMLGGKSYLSDAPKKPSIIASKQVDKNQTLFDNIKKSSLNGSSYRSQSDIFEEEVKGNENYSNENDLPIDLNSAVNNSQTTDNSSNSTELTNNSTPNNSEQTSTVDKIVDHKNTTPLFEDKGVKSNSNNNNNLTFLDKEINNSTNNNTSIDKNQKEEDALKASLKLLANSSNSNWIGQEAMDIELLDDGVSVLIQKFILDESIPKMEEDNFTLVRQAQKGKKIRFETGLVGKAGTSILLGKNTYDAWNNNNGSTIDLCPTGALGILTNYHFSLNDAVVLGIYPYSTIQQCFGGYNGDGNYEETKINLSTFDLTLGYQRTLIRYNNLGVVPSKIYARLDLGLGILTSTQTKINEQIIRTDNLYNKFNISAGLSIGNAHEINQFIIDYGITGSLGVNNLVSTFDPSVLETARLLNVGAFLGIRYIIVPRLEPSKKQRQFDWSPPFYIEEPSF